MHRRHRARVRRTSQELESCWPSGQIQPNFLLSRQKFDRNTRIRRTDVLRCERLFVDVRFVVFRKFLQIF